MILRQEPEVYIQAGGEDNGPYVLEYRDGDDDHHYSAGDTFSKEDVLRVFLWYLAGDPRLALRVPVAETRAEVGAEAVVEIVVKHGPAPPPTGVVTNPLRLLERLREWDALRQALAA